MARRKRMVYDPPHARKGKGRPPAAPPRPEQIFLTRRMLVAKAGIVGAFAALAGRLGWMQIAEGQEYSDLAKGNVTNTQNLEATRGAIVDRRGRELAVNQQTWQVRVRPADLPDAEERPEERRRVFDHLVNALGLPDALVLYPNQVPEGAEGTVYARAAQLLGKTTLGVEVTGEAVAIDELGLAGRVLRVNGVPLEVYLFETEAERRAIGRQIAPNGQLAPGYGWKTGTRLAQGGNVLTLLLSDDAALAGEVARSVAWAGEATTLDELAAMLRDTGWRRYIEQETTYDRAIVRLEDELSTDQAALCRAYASELPGVKVVNRLEWLVESGRTREAVVVQTDVSREVALKLEANKLALPGIEVDGDVLVRRYPGGEAMSHVLGYVGRVSQADIDQAEREAAEAAAARGGAGDAIPAYFNDSYKGQDGIEAKLEPELKGRNGRRIVQTVVNAGLFEEVERARTDPVPGKNLALTIDLEFQQAVSQILKEGIRFSNEDRREIERVDQKRRLTKESAAGAVVAIDPRNGEVLAMVSLPHFDNQIFVDGISQRKYQEYVSDAANKPLLNRALRGLYPPGSTCKIFIAAAALQEGKIDPTTTFNCTGSIMLPLAYDETKGNDHPCWLTSGHQAVDVYGAIEKSCDVFFYNAGTPKQALPERPGQFLHYYDVYGFGTPDKRIDSRQHDFAGLGIELIMKNLRDRFWFGQKTEIDLPAEEPASTLWDTHDRGEWAAGQTIIASIGQGAFEATPLQLALNTAALANGGTIYKPQLMREVVDAVEGATEPVESKILRRMEMRPDIFALVKEGMRRVVQNQSGTANQNRDQSSKWALTNPPGEPEIVVAGKTGTAERGERDENGNYSIQHAWFTCFAPLDEPEIAVSVIVEDGGEGSSYAVPVADRVLRAWFEISGRRGRGKVLRPEGSVPAPDGSVLSPTAAFPRPGINAVPGAQPVD